MLEPFARSQVEWKEGAGTAEAVTEEEPDVAKGGGRCADSGPDIILTGGTQLNPRTMYLSTLISISHKHLELASLEYKIKSFRYIS